MSLELILCGLFFLIGISIESWVYLKFGRWPTGLLLGLLGFAFGLSTAIVYVTELRHEAVERAVAEWNENPDGSREWKWKDTTR